MKLLEAYRFVEDSLSKLTDQYKSESDLIFDYLGYSRADIFLLENSCLTPDEMMKIESVLAKRSEHIPIQQILGFAYFYKGKFFVNSHTLIPRPETEILVDLVKECAHNKFLEIDLDKQNFAQNEVLSILEIGTGSGAVVISLANELKNCEFYGVEISKQAYFMTLLNIDNFAHSEIHISNLDARDYLTTKEQAFDIIFSNPPYIPFSDKSTLSKEVLREPEIALFSEDNGLRLYVELVPLIHKALRTKGIVIFEHGVGQEDQIEGILLKNGFSNIKKIKDLTDRFRFIKGEKNV